MSIAQQIGDRSRRIEVNQKANDFISLARLLCRAKGDPMAAAAMGVGERVPENVIGILKSAIDAGTLSDSDWASSLAPYRQVSSGFAESLRTVGAFDALLGDMRTQPLRSNIAVVSTGATAAYVPERDIKPVSALAAETVQLDAHKCVAIVAVSDSLLKLTPAAGSNMLRRELSSAVVAATDMLFISLITAGVPTMASAGSSASAILTDISNLLDSIALGSASRLYLLVTANIAKDWSMKGDSSGRLAFDGLTVRGGELKGITVIPTDGMPAGQIVLVDANGVVAGSDPIVLDASGQADVIFNDAPDSPPTVSTLPVSMWQADMVALRASRYVGAKRFRDSVAVITSAGDSP